METINANLETNKEFSKHMSYKVCGVDMTKSQRDLVIIAMVSVLVQVVANLYLNNEKTTLNTISWALGYIVLAFFLNIAYYKTFV
jgi:hypothetical protein